MSGRQKITLKQSILVWGTGDIYFIFAVMISVLFSVLSPDIQNQLRLSNTQLGLLGTAFFLCYGVAQLFTGRLFDLIGPKITLAGSAFISALGLILMAASQGFGMAITAKIITGFGLSTSYIGAIYLANTWFPEERFALISGITQMSSNILTAMLVIILALTGMFMSFRPMMVYLAILMVVIAVLIIIFVRQAPKDTSSEELSKSLHFFESFCQLIKIKQFCLGTVYFSVGFGVLLTLSDLWNIPTQIAYHHSVNTSAMMNSMFPLGGGIGALVAGWMADYLKKPSKAAQFFITGMVLFCGFVFYGPDFTIKTSFFLLFILGFFLGGTVLGFSIVGQYLPETLKGMAFGFMAMAAYLISSFLQYFVGLLLSEYHTLSSINTIHDFKIALTPLFITLMIGWFVSLWLKDNINQEDN